MRNMYLIVAILGVITCLRLLFFYLFPLGLSNGQKVTFTTVLTADPKVQNGYQHFQVRMGDMWHSRVIFITTPLYPPYSFGQTLDVAGIIKYSLLKNKKLITTISFPQIKAKSTGILPIFGTLRQRIITFCENNFSQPYAGLLVGIIFGLKNLATNQITTSFRIRGLSHLLVVDGVKVTLVVGFLLDFFSAFTKRKTALILSIGAIGMYVGLSGFEISALRAGSMAILVFGAQLVGRQYSGLYILILVVCGFLLWDPLLLENIAFQLSVLATAGILLLTPIFSKLSFGRIIMDDLAMTIAAQIATLPILLTTFGSYSLVSIPLHVLIMWTIPLIIAVGGMGIGIGLLIEPVGRVIADSVIPLLWYVASAADFFSTHGASLQISNLPVMFIIGYYCLLISLILLLQNKKHEYARRMDIEKRK